MEPNAPVGGAKWTSGWSLMDQWVEPNGPVGGA